MPFEYKREPLNDDEANTLANSCRSTEEKLIVFTLLDTGLRVSEFCSITKDAIDWQTHRLRIIGKRKKRRIVMLKGRTRDLLESYISTHEKISFGPRTVERKLQRVKTRAKIRKPVTPHVLRHTFAVSSLKKGVNLAMLQKMLGHENLGTTQVYLNLSPEDVMKEWEEKL